MTKSYAQEEIDELYRDGDRDAVSFAFLRSHVTCGYNDVDLGKTDAQALEDTFRLIKFFVESGDFEIIRTMPSPHGSIKGVSYWAKLDLAMIPYPADLEAFKKEVMEIYQAEGYYAEPFHSQIWLNKKAIGKKAPKVPLEIAKLFVPIHFH